MSGEDPIHWKSVMWERHLQSKL